MDNTLLALVNDTNVEQLYNGTCTLQVLDRHRLLSRDRWNLRSSGRHLRPCARLFTRRPCYAKVHTVIATIATIIARVIGWRGRFCAIATATTSRTLTTIFIVTVSLSLVGSSTNGSTNSCTTSHTNYCTYVTASPATGDSTDCRTENGTKLGTNIGTLSRICATAGKQEG